MTAKAWAVPGYTELQELGKGSQGRVVLARRDVDGRTVAIKYLEPRLLQDDEEASFFRSEAETLAQLDNPNVARVLSYAESRDGAAIVMEPIHGVTLRKLLGSHDDGLSAQAALVILKGSLMGLAAAHTIGLVHRDYKPTNIMVQGDGTSKLIDFGIAVLSGGQGRVGTPAYMAPEQWRGNPASPATDIYAATCVFYECVTGHRPYTGDTTQPDTATSLEELHLSGPIPTGDIPRGLRALVTKGMAKRPQDRPENATAFVAELETAAISAYGPNWERAGKAALTATTVVILTTALAPLAFTAIQHTAHTGLAALVRSKVAASVSGVAVTAAVTTYLLLPAKANPPEPPPPALTLAQAQQVLNHYQATANQAYRDLNITLLATVETKPELDMDSAYFNFSTKYRLGPVAPTNIRNPQFWIPRIAGNRPRWFVVHTGPASTVGWTWYTNGHITDDPGPGLARPSTNSTLLFTRQTDGAWKLALIADPPGKGVSYPPPLIDPQGYAQEVPPDAAGYAIAPRSLPALAANDKAANQFGKDTCTNALQTPKNATRPPPLPKTGWEGTTRFAPTNHPVFALRTSAGPALVWITLTSTSNIHKTDSKTRWRYGVGYTGLKRSRLTFNNRMTNTQLAFRAIIDPNTRPNGTSPKPYSLACGGATISYNGS